MARKSGIRIPLSVEVLLGSSTGDFALPLALPPSVSHMHQHGRITHVPCPLLRPGGKIP